MVERDFLLSLPLPFPFGDFPGRGVASIFPGKSDRVGDEVSGSCMSDIMGGDWGLLIEIFRLDT